MVHIWDPFTNFEVKITLKMNFEQNGSCDQKCYHSNKLYFIFTLGTWHGVLEGPSVGGVKGPKIKGIIAWALWRSAYWGYQVSITNKILIPMYWFKSYWFGRDISKF